MQFRLVPKGGLFRVVITIWAGLSVMITYRRVSGTMAKPERFDISLGKLYVWGIDAPADTKPIWMDPNAKVNT